MIFNIVVQHFEDGVETPVVEFDDIFATTPVFFERNLFCATNKIFLYLIVEQIPVAPAPAVDGLFHIAYNQRLVSLVGAVVSLISAVLDEREKVHPVHG